MAAGEASVPGMLADGADAARRPARVAIVTHDLHPYGAERVAAAIADTLRSTFDVRCEMASLGGGSLAAALRRTIPVHMLGALWKAPQRDVAPVAYAMRERGYRHVILNTVLCGATAPVFRSMGYAVLGLVHEMPALIRREGVEGRLASLHENAHAVVYPDEAVFGAIESEFGRLPRAAKVRFLPQGVIRRNAWRHRAEDARAEAQRLLDLPRDRPLVLAVGHGDERKGLDHFLAVARIVNERRPRPVAFAWIGDVEEAYRSRLVEQGLWPDPWPDYLRFPGYVADTTPLHRAADVFALTSREDPFPNVVLESMDAGVPVVAFAGTGGGARLAGEVAGSAVPSFDVEAFADAVEHFLDDEAARHAAGAAAARTVDERYAFDAYVGRLLDLLAEGHADARD